MTPVDASAHEEPFWTGLAESRLVLQQCDACGYVLWPIAPLCPECLAGASHWEQLSGRGTIWSFATYRRAFQPQLEDRIPYVVVAVRLAEGPLFIGQIVNPEKEAEIDRMVTFERLVIGEEDVPAWRIAE